MGLLKVSMLASNLALPREGNIKAMYHILSYLRDRDNKSMCFDPTYPEIDMINFKECDWDTFYGDTKEASLPNAPEPRGREDDLHLYVDSDHAGEELTRRSRTGVFIFLNLAPVVWFSK